MFEKETVLVALCGHSPAVVTETVWALANGEQSVIPDRVVVFTTASGRDVLCRELFEAGRWNRLRDVLAVSPDQLRFGREPSSIRVFPNPDGGELEDIASPTHSVTVADYLLEQLRGFTETPDCRIVFSIAGGRKTMSALAAMCMALLGRKGDRLCHVLVNPPFDSPLLHPGFFFPDPQIEAYHIDNHQVSATAEIQLIDIPFVPIRYLFQDYLNHPPAGYMNMVRALRGTIIPEERLSDLLVDLPARKCQVGGEDVQLSSCEFLLLAMLTHRAQKGKAHIRGATALHDAYVAYVNTLDFSKYLNLCDAKEAMPFHPGEIRKPYSRIKKKLSKALPSANSIFVDKQGLYGIILPPEKVIIRFRDV